VRLPLQSRIVTDPRGVRWRVSVRWTPWWPRMRFGGGSSDGAVDGGWWIPDVPIDADLDGGCLVFFVVVILIVVIVAVLPFLVFAFEIALLVAVAVPLALLLGFLGVAKFHIEVEREGAHGDKRVLLERHRGFMTADAAIDNLAQHLQSGQLRLDPTDRFRGGR
jgi:hypothetical protein